MLFLALLVWLVLGVTGNESSGILLVVGDVSDGHARVLAQLLLHPPTLPNATARSAPVLQAHGCACVRLTLTTSTENEPIEWIADVSSRVQVLLNAALHFVSGKT